MHLESPENLLSELMKNVGKGKIQLPDFQRELTWDDERIGSLLTSISVGYPVGVLTMLEVGCSNVKFAAKPLARLETSGAPGPERLLLNGQQRMTHRICQTTELPLSHQRGESH